MFGGAGKRGGLLGVDVPWRRGMVRREMGKEVRAREQGGEVLVWESVCCRGIMEGWSSGDDVVWWRYSWT